MSALKIYLNENLSWKISKTLREYGYDVVSSHETGMDTKNDVLQFDFAVSEKRAILTNNFGDFITISKKYASVGKSHYGIIFTTKCTIPIMIKRLREFLDTIISEQMINQIRWLNEFD